MDDLFGPFSVSPNQLVGLGGAVFQELVSRLLAAEGLAAGFAGWQLNTSHQENAPDGGVDALLTSNQTTEWIPAGESVWQFKAGDLGPEGCANELAGATFAQKVLGQGASYNLVLGKALEAKLIDDRMAKLVEKANELDLGSVPIRVIDGNQLARWVESIPALAVARVLRGVGHVAIGFDSWHQKNVHHPAWVESEERTETTNMIRSFLTGPSAPELRVEGPSGIGKTRAVLEALRSPQIESLVLYVGDADDLPPAFIEQLIRQERRAVIVVDECSRKRHKVLSEMLESGGGVRLITIGERDTHMLHSRLLGVPSLPNDTIDSIVQQNTPQLWAEARRVVVEYSQGNVRWALVLARMILDNPGATMRDIVGTGELREIVLALMGANGDFLAHSALALFTRFGHDREKQQELEIIADGLQIPLGDLRRAVANLDNAGLLTRQGRYRGVTPQPLAVLLATHAWESFGQLIMTRLLPSLDASMIERLFLRAADMGAEGPASVALNDLLGPEGPFASLDVLSQSRRSDSLVQLAVISPAAVLNHLQHVLDAATREQLQAAKTARRDLVWALEKLVWHSELFEQAADLLLRLAVAENEKISNNATGTWIGLFSTLLPATAASPQQRHAYLRHTTEQPDSQIRGIAVRAAEQALDIHGSVMVSGELQGGAVVEPRGMPKTWQEAWDYQNSTIQLLHRLATEDDDQSVRDAAANVLIGAIHPTLENVNTRDSLFAALSSLPPDGQRRVWVAMERLNALFVRVQADDGHNTDASHDVTDRVEGLTLLTHAMPPLSAESRLHVLANVRRWDFNEGELQQRIVAAAHEIGVEDATTILLAILDDPNPVEAAFEVGAALYTIADHAIAEPALTETAKTGNISGLIGFLWAAVRADQPAAFDEYLDQTLGRSLPTAARLAVTVRGPKTEVAWNRALTLQAQLPVHDGATAILGWGGTDIDDAELAHLLTDWVNRITTQHDYNSAVDTTALLMHRRDNPSSTTRALIRQLVELRRLHPDLGNQNYDWAQLAKHTAEEDPAALLTSLLEQIDSGQLTVFRGSEEQRLLAAAIQSAGPHGLTQVLDLIEAGSWRAQMEFRGWLTNLYPAQDLLAWIGTDTTRARIVASVTAVGDEGPSELVRGLLEQFGDDERVAGSLYSDLVSGSWTGRESTRIERQIAQLTAWITEDRNPPAVHTWARKVRQDLRNSHSRALEREAERGY